ncbi:hypothetical protein ACFT1A_26195 [Rhodococcus sp. NPDC057135]|uniref:hypothetical protein n=1 Tax=Rhodococcus sp. NPDC057135 TaxID=3346028 RepID=UPI0036364916
MSLCGFVGGRCWPFLARRCNVRRAGVILDLHVVTVIDHLGATAGRSIAATTVTGYKALLHWFSSIGLVARIGVEGTGSYRVVVCFCAARVSRWSK